MANKSKVFVLLGMLSFLAGGASWFFFAVLTSGNEHLAVPVAAGLAAFGGFLLILNAIINPESIKKPEINIQQPKINISPGVKGYGPHSGTPANVPGIINVNEWPIVRIFQQEKKPLTARKQMRGTLCCVFWMATVAIYLPVSFHMDNFEISWVIFIGAAVIHAIIYGLLSIGEPKKPLEQLKQQ